MIKADKEKASAQTGRIDVLSCGIGFATDTNSLTLLAKADVVYGSRTLLSACPMPLKESRIIGKHARADAAAALALCRARQRVVVLASGDALYHGFGGTLSSLSEGNDDIVYHPGITAFQALFHRLGRPWNDARLFCVHAGGQLPARDIAEAPLSVTYCGSRYSADAIARAVLAVHPVAAGRAAVIAENLGSADERILSGSLEDLAQAACGPTSMLVLFPYHHDKQVRPTDIAAPVLALGLPEESYEREANLITAPEARAVILSRLRLPAWGVLWDIGAGSGSVGLEAAALRPHLQVHGVERKSERGAIIERNRLRLGIANYTLYIGEALNLINDAGHSVISPLPAPDRIFIGGGGKDLPLLLTAGMNRLRPGGIIVVSAVTLESFAALIAWSPQCRTGLCRLDVASEQPIARTSHHLKNRNSIHIFTFCRETTT